MDESMWGNPVVDGFMLQCVLSAHKPLHWILQGLLIGSYKVCMTCTMLLFRPKEPTSDLSDALSSDFKILVPLSSFSIDLVSQSIRVICLQVFFIPRL